MAGTNKIRKIEILLGTLNPFEFVPRSIPGPVVTKGGLHCPTGIAGLLFVAQFDAVIGAVLDVLTVNFPTHRAELRATGG